jgi:hypothetical protein
MSLTRCFCVATLNAAETPVCDVGKHSINIETHARGDGTNVGTVNISPPVGRIYTGYRYAGRRYAGH